MVDLAFLSRWPCHIVVQIVARPVFRSP